MSFRPRSGVEESTQVAEITDSRENLLLGKISSLHFMSVGMTCRAVPFIYTGYIRQGGMAMDHCCYIAWFCSSTRYKIISNISNREAFAI